LFRIVRFPSKLEKFFSSLKTEFLFGHFDYFRMLVLLIAISWEDSNISSLCRHLDQRFFTHRTRYNNFLTSVRWNPEEALAKKAYEILKSLNLKKGEEIYVLVDDTKKDKRGKTMDAAGWVHDPVSGRAIWGHQYVKATLLVRGITIPFGIRLYVKDKDCDELSVPFVKVTELAAGLISSFKAPAGIKVTVLFDSYYLCPAVIKACRERGFHFISTLKSNRNLKKRGKKLKSGSYGQYCFRTGNKLKMKVKKEHRTVTYTYIDAGIIDISKIGKAHVVFSRKNKEKQIIALVTDHPKLKASEIIKTYSLRWHIEVFFKDSKQLLGLGRYQNRSYKAAVTHLHLVSFAYALLTHIAITSTCAKEKKNNKQRQSVRDLQNAVRRIIWDDTALYLKDLPNENSVFKELRHLLVAA
jgi:hypothetical protein